MSTLFSLCVQWIDLTILRAKLLQLLQQPINKYLRAIFIRDYYINQDWIYYKVKLSCYKLVHSLHRSCCVIFCTVISCDRFVDSCVIQEKSSLLKLILCACLSHWFQCLAATKFLRPLINLLFYNLCSVINISEMWKNNLEKKKKKIYFNVKTRCVCSNNAKFLKFSFPDF